MEPKIVLFESKWLFSRSFSNKSLSHQTDFTLNNSMRTTDKTKQRTAWPLQYWLLAIKENLYFLEIGVVNLEKKIEFLKIFHLFSEYA